MVYCVHAAHYKETESYRQIYRVPQESPSAYSIVVTRHTTGLKQPTPCHTQENSNGRQPYDEEIEQRRLGEGVQKGNATASVHVQAMMDMC